MGTLPTNKRMFTSTRPIQTTVVAPLVKSLPSNPLSQKYFISIHATDKIQENMHEDKHKTLKNMTKHGCVLYPLLSQEELFLLEEVNLSQAA